MFIPLTLPLFKIAEFLLCVNENQESVVEDSEEGYTFFWRSQSPFSQWHRAHFNIDSIAYNCAEQYMMHQKAGK